MTPLACATLLGRIEIMEKLLNYGANIFARDSENGDLPIHQAVSNKNHVQIAQLLHDHGSHLDHLNNEGDTPLHVAAYYGNKRVAEWLINHRVDSKALNNEGTSPSDLAESSGHNEMAEWLRSCKSNVA
ncbi:unnamed protein product, partial [Meganyctiphanes norvegica]